MPRMRPIRTAEEMADIPKDKNVVVDLAPEKEIKEDEIDIGAEPPEPELEAKSEPKPKKKEPEEDPHAEFKRQRDELQSALDAERSARAEEARRRADAEARASKANDTAREFATRADEYEYRSVLDALGAAETEADAAQSDLERAMEENNSKAAADANRRIARATGRMAQLEQSKDYLERRQTAAKEEAKKPLQQEERQQPQTVSEYVDTIPNLLPAQRDWLKSHPDVITDQRKFTRLQGYHYEAEDAGHPVGTPAYFKHLEERLGYKKMEPQVTEDEEDDDETPPRRSVSAPVSRSAPSAATGRTATTRYTLTPEQRQTAEELGIDPIEYAKQALKLDRLKAGGHYQDRG